MTHMRYVRLFLICSVFLLLPLLSHAKTIEAEADFTAWSGYWWSTNGGGLANGYGSWGEPAPLEKFEQLTLGHYPDQATNWELENHYDPGAPDWFGQCHAWASAAATENIDIVPSVIDHILFRVGDKKGLLTASHHDDPAVRVAGDAVSFHAFLLKYILQARRGFVADLGGTGEAWFYPIYRFSMNISETSSTQIVRCQIWYADDQVKPDFQGTVEHSASYEYQLDLNAAGEIVSGQWLGASVNNHPKSAFYPLSPQAANPYIDYSTIKYVATHRDDELESPHSVRLPQGIHTLVSLDEDSYYIDCLAGDLLLLNFTQMDDVSELANIVLKDDQGTIWYDAPLDGTAAIRIPVTTDSRFTLTVSRSDYMNSGIYQLQCEVSSPQDVIQPSLRKGSAWNGFALTNASNHAVKDVSVVSCDDQGRPLSTFLGPVDLLPGEKKMFTLSSFSVPLHEQGQSDTLRIVHGADLQTVFLGGDWQLNMSGFGPDTPVVSRFVIPDTSSMFDVLKAIDFGILNRGRQSQSLTLHLYSQQGFSLGSRSEVISPLTVKTYSESNNPFSASIDNGWYLVDGSSVSLQGFTNWRKGLQQYESMPGLSDFGTMFSVPHLAVDTVWNTQLTLINTTSQFNSVTCHLLQDGIYAEESIILAPYEKCVLTLGKELFASISPADLSQSALEIRSAGEMTGYFTYQEAQANARIPLVASRCIANSLIVPHVASDDYWWTGIALSNLTTQSTQLTLTPYNASGQPLSAAAVSRTINRQSKDVFALRSVFVPSVLAEMAWLEIDSTVPVNGLVLYGGAPGDVVSGYVLKKK